MLIVNFDLGRLPDPAINLLVRGTEEGARTFALPKSLHEQLERESLWRQEGSRGRGTRIVRIDPLLIAGLTTAELQDQLMRLYREADVLQRAANFLAEDSAERDAYQAASRFLFSVIRAIGEWIFPKRPD